MSETRSFLDGDGVRLAWFARGDPASPTIVLIHGYPDTHAVWNRVAERLADRFHVVTYDVRGAGASDRPRQNESYDLSHLMADLTAVIDEAAGDEPVHLVGHDWGSLQGWEAIVTPSLEDRIASYTSISGPSLDHLGNWIRDRRAEKDYRSLLRQASKSWYIALFRVPFVADFGWRNGAARLFAAGLRREGVAVEGEHPAPTLALDGESGVELYRRNIFSRIRRPTGRTSKVPTQLIVASEDPFVTPPLLDGLEKIAPDFERCTIDAGHWCPVTHPDQVAELIADHATG